MPLLALVVLLPLLAACGDGGSAVEDSREVAWDQPPETPLAPIPTIAPSITAATEVSGAGGGGVPVTLGSDDLARFQPNELGRIPILMYHAFTTNEAYLDDWTVTPEIFLDDLTWLYEHDFYVVSVADMINNEISAPPGKHPVVLTFDDASSGQFRLFKDDHGAFYPDPVTAVGVMEQFFADHPDFGRGGFFAVVPNNCFHKEGEVSTCEERISWLADHGYEIGNHTWDHNNLADVSDTMLMQQVGDTKIWIDQRVSGDANLSNVLVLPFGNFPGNDRQRQMLRDGFVWDGQDIVLAGIMIVVGGPSESPSSGEWTRWNISRFNADRTIWGYWKEQIESGAITLFTSDGNPATVTIPDPIPADIAPQFDPEWASSYGMRLIRYTPSATSADPAADALALAIPPRQRGFALRPTRPGRLPRRESHA